MASSVEVKQTGVLRWGLFVLLVTLAAAALRLLRLYALAPSPFEGAMMLRIGAGLAAIWRGRAASQAPLADIAFWLAAQFPGDDLTNARIVSAAAGALALPVFWLAAARASDGVTAILAITLLAFSPLAVSAAYTAEPVPLALLALALVWLAFEHLRQRRNTMMWLLLGGASLLATLVYTPLAVLLVPMLATLLINGQRRTTLIGVGSSALLCLLGFFTVGNATTLTVVPTVSGLPAIAIMVFTGGAASLPQPFEQVVLFAFAIGALVALIDWQRWERLLPYISQYAFGLAAVVVAPRLVGGGAAIVLLLPAMFLLIASGLRSLSRVRFGWPLAAVLAAVLLAAVFVGAVDLVVG